MNKLLFTLIAMACLSLPVHAQSELFVEYSSVEAFFELADKVAAGIEPTEEEWNELFATRGYKKCIAETFDERGDFTRRALILAFSPEKTVEKDSIVSIPVADIVSDWEALLLRVMLNNFLHTKQRQAAIKEQLKAINGEWLQAEATQILKDFLVNPVDSLISPIPISLICMEPDALSLSGRIVWDLYSFSSMNEEQRAELVAHEMYHAYRRHFSKKSTSALVRLIDDWLNEGVADLIDKKSLSDLTVDFLLYGLPQAYIDEYQDIYNSTPQMLKELEELTFAFIRNEVDEKTYNAKLEEFDQFGGHPNGYFMTTTIRKAGFEKELVTAFVSPVEFIKLYNQSVEKEYALSNEFIAYLEGL